MIKLLQKRSPEDLIQHLSVGFGVIARPPDTPQKQIEDALRIVSKVQRRVESGDISILRAGIDLGTAAVHMLSQKRDFAGELLTEESHQYRLLHRGGIPDDSAR